MLFNNCYSRAKVHFMGARVGRYQELQCSITATALLASAVHDVDMSV